MAPANMRRNVKSGFAILLILGLLIAMSALIISGCSNDKIASSYTDEEMYASLYTALFSPSQNETYEVVKTDSAVIEMNFTAGVADTITYNIEGLPNTVRYGNDLLSNPTALTMNCDMLRFVRGVDSTRSALLYVCQPDGTVFNDSLTIDLDPGYFNNNVNSNVVKLYAYSELQNRWLLYDNCAKSDPRIIFNITHFSKYAIAD